MLEILGSAGRVTLFAGRLSGLAGTRPRFVREWFRHVSLTCRRSFVPVVVIVCAFAAVVALQGMNIFRIFGTQPMLPSLVVVAILREAAPTFAALMLAAQAGSSVAAELAVMRVKEELDATEVMSVDGLRFHVVPRVVALALSAPVLTVLSALFGILVAWGIVTTLGGVSHGVFRENMFSFLTMADLFAGVVKSLSYGLLTGIVATYHGYHCGRGARGVGMAANRAVVTAIVGIVVCNYILTSAIFGAAS